MSYIMMAGRAPVPLTDGHPRRHAHGLSGMNPYAAPSRPQGIGTFGLPKPQVFYPRPPVDATAKKTGGRRGGVVPEAAGIQAARPAMTTRTVAPPVATGSPRYWKLVGLADEFNGSSPGTFHRLFLEKTIRKAGYGFEGYDDAAILLADRGLDLVNGPLEMVGVLGDGGCGTVLKARRRVDGRQFAVKEGHANHLGLVTQWNEMAASIRIGDHDNVLRCYCIEDREGQGNRILYEYCDGGDLYDVANEKIKLPTIDLIELLKGVVAGLGHVHRCGIVHRDIKTENVFIKRREGGGYTPVIGDFGLADVVGSTRSQQGTIGFLPPEAILCAVASAFDQDVFAMGHMMLQLFTAPSYRRANMFFTPVDVTAEELCAYRSARTQQEKDTIEKRVTFRLASSQSNLVKLLNRSIFLPDLEGLPQLIPGLMKMLSPDPGSRPNLEEITTWLQSLERDLLHMKHKGEAFASRAPTTFGYAGDALGAAPGTLPDPMAHGWKTTGPPKPYPCRHDARVQGRRREDHAAPRGQYDRGSTRNTPCPGGLSILPHKGYRNSPCLLRKAHNGEAFASGAPTTFGYDSDALGAAPGTLPDPMAHGWKATGPRKPYPCRHDARVQGRRREDHAAPRGQYDRGSTRNTPCPGGRSIPPHKRYRDSPCLLRKMHNGEAFASRAPTTFEYAGDALGAAPGYLPDPMAHGWKATGPPKPYPCRHDARVQGRRREDHAVPRGQYDRGSTRNTPCPGGRSIPPHKRYRDSPCLLRKTHNGEAFASRAPTTFVYAGDALGAAPGYLPDPMAHGWKATGPPKPYPCRHDARVQGRRREDHAAPRGQYDRGSTRNTPCPGGRSIPPHKRYRDSPCLLRKTHNGEAFASRAPTTFEYAGDALGAAPGTLPDPMAHGWKATGPPKPYPCRHDARVQGRRREDHAVPRGQYDRGSARNTPCPGGRSIPPHKRYRDSPCLLRKTHNGEAFASRAPTTFEYAGDALDAAPGYLLDPMAHEWKATGPPKPYPCRHDARVQSCRRENPAAPRGQYDRGSPRNAPCPGGRSVPPHKRYRDSPCATIPQMLLYNGSMRNCYDR